MSKKHMQCRWHTTQVNPWVTTILRQSANLTAIAQVTLSINVLGTTPPQFAVTSRTYCDYIRVVTSQVTSKSNNQRLDMLPSG